MDRIPKICFVVLAHHQPVVFHRLLDHLPGENSEVVVHVDKRSDLARFTRPAQEEVHFLPRRSRVHWGGWSLTQAILDGLSHGLDVTDADYFMYLAGTDFPIKSRQQLGVFLQENFPRNYLNHYPLVPGIWGHGLIGRYRFMDLRARLQDQRHEPNQAPSTAGHKLLNAWLRFENRINRRLGPRDTTWTRFYSGSSRWCLNRATVEFVIRHTMSPQGRKLRRFFKASTNSDELFFQTVILNSSMKDQCVGFDEQECMEIFEHRREPMPDEKRVFLHHIDWNPERENPAIMQLQDFQELAGSDKFFACKFLEEHSLDLIARLETELLS